MNLHDQNFYHRSTQIRKLEAIYSSIKHQYDITAPSSNKASLGAILRDLNDVLQAMKS